MNVLGIIIMLIITMLLENEFKNRSDYKMQAAEIILFFVQLFFNYMWAILFFRLEARWFAFGWLVMMWMMVLTIVMMCAKNCKIAAWCLVPYVLWCAFAMYLNIMIEVLN